MFEGEHQFGFGVEDGSKGLVGFDKERAAFRGLVEGGARVAVLAVEHAGFRQAVQILSYQSAVDVGFVDDVGFEGALLGDLEDIVDDVEPVPARPTGRQRVPLTLTARQ